MKKLILPPLFFFLFYLQSGCAQNNPNSISVTAIQGITIFAPYNKPLTGNFYGAEIAARFNMSNNNADWVHILHIKDIALTASCFNLQNISIAGVPGSRAVLGSNYGLLTMLDIALFNAGKTVFLFSPGMGFVYASQTYYTNTNPLVGSHINLAVQAGFKIETPIWASTKITAGVDFFHYSNSAFRLPNDGINNINASLGIVRDINSDGPERNKATFVAGDKSSLEFGIGIGRRGFIQAGQIYQHANRESNSFA